MDANDEDVVMVDFELLIEIVVDCVEFVKDEVVDLWLTVDVGHLHYLFVDLNVHLQLLLRPHISILSNNNKIRVKKMKLKTKFQQ